MTMYQRFNDALSKVPRDITDTFLFYHIGSKIVVVNEKSEIVLEFQIQ